MSAAPARRTPSLGFAMRPPSRSAALAVLAVMAWLSTAGCGSPDLGASPSSSRPSPDRRDSVQPGDDDRGFATVLPGTGVDQARDVAVAADGSVILVGGTESSDFPVTHDLVRDDVPGRPVTLGSAGPMAVFVVKLAPDGSVRWSTLVGGPGYDRAYAVELGPRGRIYVAGRAGGGFPTTPGVVQPSFAGDDEPNGAYGPQDGFVFSLLPDGSAIEWSTYLGDRSRSFIRDLDVHADGSVVVGLHARGSFPHGMRGVDSQPPGRDDVVVARLDAAATRVEWAAFVGGAGDEGVPTVRLDDAGRVFVLTSTTSDDVTGTDGAFQTARRGDADLLLVRLTAAGAREAATLYGGSGPETVETHHLALDPLGRPVIGAATASTDLPLPPDGRPVQGRNGGALDGFVAILSRDLTRLIAATYLGGSGSEHVEGVAVDADGNVYVGGETSSPDLPSASGTLRGPTDAWTAKLAPGLDRAAAIGYWGGARRDAQRAVAVDPDGHLISAGWTGFVSFFDRTGDAYAARVVMP